MGMGFGHVPGRVISDFFSSYTEYFSRFMQKNRMKSSASVPTRHWHSHSAHRATTIQICSEERLG
jgi:hypothetical protein